MTYTYHTNGTCSTVINFSIDDGIISDVSFTGGCHGNLQAISRLVDGKPADEIASILKGVDCRGRGTSCGDQLSRAIEEVLDK